MTKRFVIGTKTLSSEQEASLLSYIRKSGAGWWHWLPNFWLIKDSKEKLTASDLIDALDGAQGLVMEIPEDITWAGRVSPNNAGKEPFDWLKNVWKE
jgi:hypothetical protein